MIAIRVWATPMTLATQRLIKKTIEVELKQWITHHYISKDLKRSIRYALEDRTCALTLFSGSRFHTRVVVLDNSRTVLWECQQSRMIT